MTLRREGKALVLEGAVTLETVPGLITAAEEHFRQGIGVIDFSAVTDVDSAAVALALEWVRRAERANVVLRLVNLPGSMQNLARLYGVSELLQTATGSGGCRHARESGGKEGIPSLAAVPC